LDEVVGALERDVVESENAGKKAPTIVRGASFVKRDEALAFVARR